MDIFSFRNALTRDYSEYVRSFINIRTSDVREYVDKSLDSQELWPEPLVQLNPAYAPGARIPDLVKSGVLHPTNADVFRRGKSSTSLGVPLTLYQHQVEAIQIARGGHNYVVTTGTGSGKSLTYIIPIVDHILREGSGRGIRAIVVYPMNALANSQAGEMEKFLAHGLGDRAPVTFKRFTGQDDEETRATIRASPPDILLTNYVMLELLMTRGTDTAIVKAASDLKFLVFDELHTYRGRQGADVAMLIRRVRDRVGSRVLQFVGTSATMGSKGSLAQQRAEVASVATKVFGAEVKPEHIVGETLSRVTKPIDTPAAGLSSLLRESVQAIDALIGKPYADFVTDPLCSWLESTIGVHTDAETGTLVRQLPRRLTGDDSVAVALEQVTGLPAGSCAGPLQRLLNAGYEKLDDPTSDRPQRAFAFRLHQFYNRGDTVYASPLPPDHRHVTLRAQKLVPGKPEHVLLPLAFCRECGHEYYTVWRQQDEGTVRFTPRRLGDGQGGAGAERGYLYQNPEDPWPALGSPEEFQALPGDWIEEHRGELRVKRDKRERRPSPVSLLPGGQPGIGGASFQYVPGPLHFCLNCRVYYPTPGSEFGRLSVLGTGGRSTATTVLSLSAIRQLQAASDMEPEARKLLSFTDNRQDASLQSGHFNDFVEVGQLRGALYKAVLDAGDAGLGFDDVSPAVFEALDLELADYAASAGEFVVASMRNESARALREVLAYRIFRDLERGWRVTSPNLEQVGLLRIQYPDLDDACSNERLWAGSHVALATATPQERASVARVLLEHLRKNLAIEVEWLDSERQEQLKTRSHNLLTGRWALDDRESLAYHTTAYPRSETGGERGKNVFISGRGLFARYLRREGTFGRLSAALSVDDSQSVIRDLMERLCSAGFLVGVQAPRNATDVAGYRLAPQVLRWTAGDGSTGYDDPLKTIRSDGDAGKVNQFFRRFYAEVALNLRGPQAREHTAAVPAQWREEREAEFRTGKLPILYCSPTMELGVDIADLNVVNMRNVPPTPANYAQRSGRAGRGGQPALVYTYCTTGSSHDQYYFSRQEQMVAGIVQPPRLDLANEDLVRAHVQAVWLAETGVELGRSLGDVLSIEDPNLPLRAPIHADINDAHAKRRAAKRVEAVLSGDATSLATAAWYHPDWISDTLQNAADNFDLACNRWRELYRGAQSQFRIANNVIEDATKTSSEKQQARRQRSEAENQLALLTESGSAMQSDFYSYRYFASEGFLPGYSFPRLPLAAFIPGRRLGVGRDEFVQRPRFLAIKEFGPRALIYHEGSKYRVEKVNFTKQREEDGIADAQAKLCSDCGYLHPITTEPGPDTCENCGAQLGGRLVDLLRLQNVTARRVERINSDEEERQRMGYEVITAVRFATTKNGPDLRKGQIVDADGKQLAGISVAPSATLWRINLGWRRRENPNIFGFPLDLKTGKWASNKEAEQLLEGSEDDATVEGFAAVKTVIPYVDDTRNALLWAPETSLSLDETQFLSLRDALAAAIRVEYQLENSELAAEVLPSNPDADPKVILLYEAAEGGAGVLRHLLDEPASVARVARRALEICHFDPDSGEDLGHAPHTKERCESACYDCLLSYNNQPAHDRLDRHAIRDHLLELAQGQTEASSSHLERGDHLAMLMRQTGSELERDFLRLLESRGLRLPTHAQQLVKDAGTRPDFTYLTNGGLRAVVYVDGPHHDYPERQLRDCEQDQQLDDLGYTVVRFHHKDDWPAALARYSWVFGEPRP